MKDGWIKLYRKILDNPLYRERREFSRFEAWIDLLLNASHKENDFMLGSEMVHCGRGELITSESRLMERWHWSKSKVRHFLNVLLKDQAIDQQTDHRKTKIIIKNYSTYQDSQTSERPVKEPVNVPLKDPINNNKEVKKKDPSAISSKIASISQKLFPGEDGFFSRMIQAISQTRKAGKVAPSVILSFLQSLEKFPQEKIRAGIQTYLDREYWKEGKDEKYLFGIIRNETKRVAQALEFKSTGSPLLDAHYRKQEREGQA